MIPVVDFGCCVDTVGVSTQNTDKNTADRPEVSEQTATLLHDAICEHGFCFLTNHGVPENVISNVFSASKKFFEQPGNIKAKYARAVETNHGWVSLERERLNPSRPCADMKEAFNFSPNEDGTWPTEVPEMNPSFHKMVEHCRQLLGHVLDSLSVGLELPDKGFLRRCHQLCGQKKNSSAFRSLYYPTATTLKEGQIECGEHSDYGSITLLFQDDIGGLQVLGKDGQYHNVKPIPGAVLVNVGDLIQRWTNDKYPATKHRVIIPRQAIEQGRARQSLAFFCHPDDDTLITCLDGSNTYPSITAYDYLMQRFAATY